MTGYELTEENKIRFWASCMHHNEHGPPTTRGRRLNVPERPTPESKEDKALLWNACHEMNESGLFKGRIEMPEKPDGI